MNRFKKLAVSLLLAMPMMVSAAGMGIYVPFNITETEEIDNGYPTYGTTTLEYKSAPGIGIAFDSNIGKDKVYNYRLGLEYHTVELDKVNGNAVSGGTYEKSKFNIVNTFGFGVLRTKTVRLWVGPRINIQYENGEYSSSEWDAEAEEGCCSRMGRRCIGSYIVR